MNVLPVIVTHGGVGSKSKDSDGCLHAAEVGMEILRGGGSALDAVVAACVLLEDDPRYNAGAGSNLRLDGSLEMDAGLMTGAGEIGAVGAIRGVKNPVLVARQVMDTPHVLLAGSGAIEFARRNGHPEHDNTTPHATERLEAALERLGSGDIPSSHSRWSTFEWTGTVGAVARDCRGCFAGGNSTGGTSFMLPGRVGDSPLPGAGYWAGEVGAVASTGIGEEIIRKLMSRRIYDSLAAGDDAQGAAEASLAIFPEGLAYGVIVVSRHGHGIAATHQMAAAALSDETSDRS